MEDVNVLEFYLPDNILQPFLNSANCSMLDEALGILINHARTEQGRLELASKNTVFVVLELIKQITTRSRFSYLLSSLKLLRNLCAGERQNQTSFIQNNGVETISAALNRVGFASDSDIGIVRTGLQVLGNVALAGDEHQREIWLWFFPDKFLEIVKMRYSEICDPLCMVIYSCCGSSERLAEFSSPQGLEIVGEIIKTASTAGFGEDWLKWLLSKVCFDEHHFPTLFHLLSQAGVVATGEEINSGAFSSKEQSFLLGVLSECLNQQTDAFSVSRELAMFVFGILKKAYGTVDFSSRGKLGLPTGFPSIDVLGYSMVILRDICAQNGPWISRRDDSVNIVDSLLSSGLLELLLNILRELEPPEMIRRCTPQDLNEDPSRTPKCMKKCPYRGFRRDIVAVIANCLYRRKHAQDEIRQSNGILLLLQQCVTEDDNPFLREWGLYLGRNLVEGNKENGQEIAELRLEATVDIPELTRLGLQVVVNEATGRPKIINIS